MRGHGGVPRRKAGACGVGTPGGARSGLARWAASRSRAGVAAPRGAGGALPRGGAGRAHRMSGDCAVGQAARFWGVPRIGVGRARGRELQCRVSPPRARLASAFPRRAPRRPCTGCPPPPPSRSPGSRQRGGRPLLRARPARAPQARASVRRAQTPGLPIPRPLCPGPGRRGRRVSRSRSCAGGRRPRGRAAGEGGGEWPGGSRRGGGTARVGATAGRCARRPINREQDWRARDADQNPDIRRVWSDCRNPSPRAGRGKQDLYFLTVLGAARPSSGCTQSGLRLPFPSSLPAGRCLLPASSCGLSSVPRRPCLSTPPLLTRTRMGLGPTISSLQRPCLRTQSHSEDWDRTSTYGRWGAQFSPQQTLCVMKTFTPPPGVSFANTHCQPPLTALLIPCVWAFPPPGNSQGLQRDVLQFNPILTLTGVREDPPG